MKVGSRKRLKNAADTNARSSATAASRSTIEARVSTSAMPQLLSSAGLFTVSGHTQLPVDTHLMVTAAADVVGAQVLSPYAAFGPPVSFQGVAAPSPDFNWVVRVTKPDNSPGDPIVIHRIVR